MRIGELAAAAGTTTKTLRFYEETGLLPPTERAANGYRDYGPEVLARLEFITCTDCSRQEWSTSIGRSLSSMRCAPPSSNDATKQEKPIRPPAPPRRSVDTCNVTNFIRQRAPGRLAAATGGSFLTLLGYQRTHRAS